jgi:hypothetical protein
MSISRRPAIGSALKFVSVPILAAMLLPCGAGAQGSDSPTAAASGSSVTYCAGTCNGVPTQWKLFGAAEFEKNSLCPGGFMIDGIGVGAANYAELDFTVPVGGTYHISFAEETAMPRRIYVALDSESGTQVSGSPYDITGSSFKTPVEFQAGDITLPAGTNKLIFFNPESSGQEDRTPYISAVTITGPM